MLEPIDIYVIEQVKKKRIEKGVSQSQLAFELDLANSFIGMVESKNYQHKYSLAQLNKIAKLFACSVKEFLPDDPI